MKGKHNVLAFFCEVVKFINIQYSNIKIKSYDANLITGSKKQQRIIICKMFKLLYGGVL